MSGDPRRDVVAEQYERWVYPEPIEDIPAWLKHSWQWFDPSHAHRLMWPDRPYRPDLQILVAGCGTHQAAVLAHTNPAATIVAIDVSEASLAHHRVLKERFGLRNLELHHLAIENVAALDRDFDLIVSTGVLHHLADPQAGMNALAACLRPDGVVALMLYARYGRLGVEVMESVFDDLALVQDEHGVAIVRDALAVLPPQHPVRSYLSIAPDLAFDAGLVDTFLHGRARNYTVDECIDLVEQSGLVFQDWLLKSSYEPVRVPGSTFLSAVSDLPDRTRWSVMERITTTNACHFLLACRPERPVDRYRIDLRSDRASKYIPSYRHHCGVEGDTLVKPGWRETLTGTYPRIASLIDGQRTLGAIADMTVAPGEDRDEVRTVVLVFLETLWHQDYVALGLPPTS